MGRAADTDTPGLLPNRACRNCVQIKVKCLPSEGSTQNVCQRCHRLGKTCTTPAPVPRKHRAKSTRVTQLEERIERLTALLTPQQTVSDSSAPSTAHNISHASETPTSQSSRSDGVSAEQSVRIVPQTIAHRAHVSDAGTDPKCSWISGEQPIARSGSPTIFIPQLPGRKDGSQLLNEDFCPVHLEADLEVKLFDSFRYEIIQHFPFVVIDPRLTADEFKEKQPFCYWAGIYVASHNMRKLQQKLHDEMMKAIGHRMLFSGSKCLDLLQGILILTAWQHNMSHYNPQLMNLLHLAQALLADLGLSKAVRVQDKIRISSDFSAMMHCIETTTVDINPAKARAVLGCFFISSKTALVFNRIDPTKYSQHTDDCCRKLQEASEYESDVLLVQLVQLHRIFGKYLQVDPGSITSSNAYRKMFQDEIEQYRQNLPPSVRAADLLESEVLAGSLYFLEPSYTAENIDKIDYLNALHTCVDIGHKMIAVFCRLSDHEWPNIAFTYTMSMMSLLVVLSRLSFFKHENYDIQYAWRTIDLSSILDQLVNLFERVQQAEVAKNKTLKPWRFEIYQRKVRHVKTWFEAKVAAEEAIQASLQDDIMPNNFTDTLFGNFDDSMWADFMGNWSNF